MCDKSETFLCTWRYKIKWIVTYSTVTAEFLPSDSKAFGIIVGLPDIA